MWTDATIAASFPKVDGVAYAQSPTLVTQLGKTGYGHGQWLFLQVHQMLMKRRSSSNGQLQKLTSRLVANHKDFGWGSVPTGTRSSTYAYPEFQAVAGFASAEMVMIESVAPEATDLKPYVGVQFAAIPEFPEVVVLLHRKWLRLFQVLSLLMKH